MTGLLRRKRLMQFLSLFLVSQYVSNYSLAVTIKEKSDVEAKISIGYDETEYEEKISTTLPSKGDFFVKGASDFVFPDIELGEKDYAMFNNAKVDTMGVEVVDLRGTGTGWNLRVTLGPITLKDDSTTELKNFSFVIPTKEVTTKSSSLTRLPEGHEVMFANSGEKTIFSAGKDKGMGKYTNVFVREKDKKSKGVSLKVPITAKKGNYVGQLDWTLIDGPT